MIIYFSATGNTKYCADILADYLDDEIIDSTEYIREKKKGSFESGRPWIFCTPIYVAYIPLVFEKFLKESEFKGNESFYFVLTLGGNENGGSIAPKILKPLCAKLGKKYMGTGHVPMVSNYVMLKDVQDKDAENNRAIKAKDTLKAFAEKIKALEMLPEFKINKVEYICVRPFLRLYYKMLFNDKKFYADSRCTSCGLCEKICPLGNITMKDGKPGWNGNCTHCTACINRCPSKAIQYGEKTKERSRYYLKM